MLISSSLVGSLLTAVGAQFGGPIIAAPTDGSVQQQVAARIWVDTHADYFRRGDRMNVRFSLSDDAYVAILHIDTEGHLDILYPASPWDNEWVRGRQVHTLPVRGAGGSHVVRGRRPASGRPGNPGRRRIRR